MGCGGSKEEVATGNTVPTTHIKAQPQDSNAETRKKKSTTTKSTVVKEEDKAEEVTAGNDKIEVDDTKDIVTATVSSPDHYFSPRKDEIFHEIESNEVVDGGDLGSVVAPEVMVVVAAKVEEGSGGCGSSAVEGPPLPLVLAEGEKSSPIVVEQIANGEKIDNSDLPKEISDAVETIVEKKPLGESER